VEPGRVRADLAYTRPVPKAARSGHTVALGVDWGLNTMLSAGAARLHGDGRITALGAGGMFRAAGVLARQHRLRRHGEQLHAKAGQYERLAGDGTGHPLAAKHRALTREIQCVSDRRSNLNDALARAAARWTADQAIAAGATVIYVEDLRSMEAKGMGRTMNGPIPGGAGADHRPHAAPRRRGGHRRRHRAREEHLEALPAVPRAAEAPQSPRPALRTRLEMGRLRLLRLAGRPRHGRVAAHRRPRPHPPGDDRGGPRQRGHGHPLRGGQPRSRGGHHAVRPPGQPGPVQDRPHPAQDSTSGAQATPDTLPRQAEQPGGQASGGTRSHGPAPAAPRSQPEPGRDDDQHPHPAAPAARGSTGRRIPPARSRHPSTVGRTHTRPYVLHGIA